MKLPVHIEDIKLSGLIPRVFDDPAGRERFASSQLMLAEAVLHRGTVYCVNASSGSGKTSLCSFIYGVRDDYSGHISFDNIDARSLSVDDWCMLRRRNLAYLPQELELFDSLSAIDNVRLKNRLTGHKSEDEISAMFKRLEISDIVDRPAGRISVGQKQRVAIIRALCQPFDFIILDEPVSHLDTYNNGLCGALIVEEARRQQAGIVFTSVGNPLSTGVPVIPLKL